MSDEGTSDYRNGVFVRDSVVPGRAECVGWSMKKAVFLYDFTGLMAQPWLADNFECWLFDGQHAPGITREGNIVKVGMWFYPYGLEYQAATIKALVGDGVEVVFGFPECTDLTVAGAKHWKKSDLSTRASSMTPWRCATWCGMLAMRLGANGDSKIQLAH